MRLAALTLAALLLCAGPAWTATISISTVSNNSTCLASESNNAGTQYTWTAPQCSDPGTIFGETQFFAVSDSGTATSPNVLPTVVPSSTSVGFGINAGVSVDDVSGDAFVRGQVRYTLQVTVDADQPGNTWTVDVNHDILGLLALRGDGTASAVGTQSNGESQIQSLVVLVDGNNVSFGISGSSLINNPSNNGSSTQQFSGGSNTLGVVSGTGDSTFSITIAYDLDAFSNDGCSGSICSSISGGEEAAVLAGLSNVDGVGNPSADAYGTWGRAVGPDGYDLTLTLNIAPEPTTALLLGLGLVGMGAAWRRRRS